MTPVAVAAPHRAAVEAAEVAVRNGGNAVDAALAAAVTLTVVYPHQCSLGGDLVALLHLPGGDVRAVLSIGATPADALPVNEIPRQGALSVTVPGVVAGWQALTQAAVLPLAEPLRYAAELARAGVPVSPGLAHAVEDRRDAVLADPGLRDLLLGDVLHQPRLAETLDALAADPREFYDGAIAARLVEFLRRGGSQMSTADFARHEAEIAEPLTLDLPKGVGSRRHPRVRAPSSWRCWPTRTTRGWSSGAGVPRRPAIGCSATPRPGPSTSPPCCGPRSPHRQACPTGRPATPWP